MQDSLAGNGKILMVVNAAPEERNAGETLCSLQFAARVRGVELGGAKRTVESGSEIRGLTEELARLKAQVPPFTQLLTHPIMGAWWCSRTSGILQGCGGGG